MNGATIISDSPDENRHSKLYTVVVDSQSSNNFIREYNPPLPQVQKISFTNVQEPINDYRSCSNQVFSQFCYPFVDNSNSMLISRTEINEAFQYIKLICEKDDKATNYTSSKHENEVRESIPSIEASKESDDDDVIFVSEYRPEPKMDHLSLDVEIVDPEDGTGNENTPKGKLVKRRRQQKCCEQPRRNPIRRVKEDKVPLMLAEKFSIPQSVFNARIKTKSKAEVVATVSLEFNKQLNNLMK